MIKRKIIKINEEKCNGCGLCLPGCPEGALQIVDGKAKLVKESFCDGLGACIGECPQGALAIEEREAEKYDKEGVIAHLREKSPELLEKHLQHLKTHEHELHQHHTTFSCPSAQVMHWKDKEEGEVSGLNQWPVQLHLVPPSAPYFQNADLVLVADCVPFAYPKLHNDYLKGKAIAVGCPKLDDSTAYESKIKQIIQNSNLNSLKVIYMEVPCCYGLVHITKEALKKSGKDTPLETVMVGIKGEIREENAHPKVR